MSLWSRRVMAWVWWVLVARAAAVVGRSTLGIHEPMQDMRLDQDTMNYLLPHLAEKFTPDSWQQVMDPRLYVLSELESQDENIYDGDRTKRRLPSLSIVNPMEVLRQRLLLEIARKQQRENAVRKAGENRVFLQQVGKRTEQDNDLNHLFLDNNEVFNIIPIQQRSLNDVKQRHHISGQLRRERNDEI